MSEPALALPAPLYDDPADPALTPVAEPPRDCRTASDGRDRPDDLSIIEKVRDAITTFRSIEEFLAAEGASERRHELVAGRAYLMAGGTVRHNVAVSLLYEAVAPGARAAGCRRFMHNQLVRTPAGSMYYPDIMIACGRVPHVQYEENPTLLVEVLSPSTATIDRREKAVAYTSIESLRLYLIVDPHYTTIELARRDGDRRLVCDAFGPGDRIVTDYGDIDVGQFYEELNATATT